jgi:hypothetical protein
MARGSLGGASIVVAIRGLRDFLGKHSAPPNAASKEGVPTVFGRIVLLVLLINGFAMT